MTVDPDAIEPDAGAVPVDAIPDKPIPEGGEGDLLEQESVVDMDDDEYPHGTAIDDE